MTFLKLYKLRRDCGWAIIPAIKSAWRISRHA